MSSLSDDGAPLTSNVVHVKIALFGAHLESSPMTHILFKENRITSVAVQNLQVSSSRTCIAIIAHHFWPIAVHQQFETYASQVRSTLMSKTKLRYV